MSTAETNAVLVTGANGFVGKSLCEEMIRQGRPAGGIPQSQPYMAQRIWQDRQRVRGLNG